MNRLSFLPCSKFATYYNGGKIPVRIDHFGSGKNRIQWDCPIARAFGSVSHVEILCHER